MTETTSVDDQASETVNDITRGCFGSLLLFVGLTSFLTLSVFLFYTQILT